MKNAIVSLFVLAASITAQATSLHPETFTERTSFKQIEMDKDFNMRVDAASLSVNQMTKVAKLTLHQASRCAPPAPGQFRCLGMPAPFVIEMEIVRVEQDRCGSTTIIARKDMMPVDGALDQVRIVDHRSNRCRIYIPADKMTQVTYTHGFFDRINGQPVQMTSKLSGPALQ